MMKMKLNKLISALSVAALAVSLCCAPAFALAPAVEDTAEEAATPTETEVVEASAPLTPDGNLTLVDDVGSSTGVGKQFITFVTKNGNYFYLIIDRDDTGDETVHLLNLVDEADLLALMEDEDVEAYQAAQAAQTATQPVEEPAATATPEPTPVQEEPQPQTEKATKKNVLPAVIALLALAAGGGVFGYMQFRKKKQAEQNKPDPDADYEEEDVGGSYDAEDEADRRAYEETDEEESDYGDDADEADDADDEPV
jgi:hypothetical protein